MPARIFELREPDGHYAVTSSFTSSGIAYNKFIVYHPDGQTRVM